MKDPNNTSGITAPGSTDPRMLAGLREGKDESWQVMASLYSPLVYFWCRRIRMDRHDAEDVLQNVFLTVANKVDEFRDDGPDSSFRGWLWSIARNKIGDWIRSRNSQGSTVAFLDEVAEESLDEEPDATDGTALLCRQALRSIREEFQETTWQAFWLVVVEEREPAEVAEELGISRNATYIARSRVLRRLREVLGTEVR